MENLFKKRKERINIFQSRRNNIIHQREKKKFQTMYLRAARSVMQVYLMGN